MPPCGGLLPGSQPASIAPMPLAVVASAVRNCSMSCWMILVYATVMATHGAVSFGARTVTTPASLTSNVDAAIPT